MENGTNGSSDWVTVKQAREEILADVYKDHTYIYELAKTKRIKARKFGGVLHLSRADVVKLRDRKMAERQAEKLPRVVFPPTTIHVAGDVFETKQQISDQLTAALKIGNGTMNGNGTAHHETAHKSVAEKAVEAEALDNKLRWVLVGVATQMMTLEQGLEALKRIVNL